MALISLHNDPLTTTIDLPAPASDFTEYLGASIESTWDRNPLQLLRRQADIYEAQYGVEQISDLQTQAEEGGLSFEPTDLKPLQVQDELSIDQQKEYITSKSTRAWLDSGRDGSDATSAQGGAYSEKVLKDYGIKPEEKLNAAALDIIMAARERDQNNADIRERAPAWMTPFGIAADFATAMVDPINIGSGLLIPSAAGSNFYLRALQEAGEMTASNAFKRGAVRFAAGAFEGAAGTAVIEPMNYGLSQSQQFEYGALDSLLNIAAGGVLGGTFKSIAGGWGEHVRRKRGQRQEWHVAIPDAESEALREAFKADILRHAREVGADKIGEYEADAAAGVWDATARTVSYDMKQATRKFYDDNPIEWRRITKEEMNSDSFGLGFVSNSDPDTRWVPGFKNIEANPYTIDYTPQAAPGDKAALPPLIKSAYDENLARYKGKELPFLDENGEQQNARVSSVGLNELLRKRNMSEDDIAVANNLPNILSNTRIYRIDKANDKHGVARSVMHGVAAVNLNGESVLVRSVFKRAKDANGEFWQYYGSNIMHGKNNDGASVSAIHQAKALHHPSETPSLGKTLYEWMSNVNDKGQRFPGDISVLEQTAWNGSVVDFDSFSTDMIGSGEGAQAHGWGLYAAQDMNVSDINYRERLTTRAANEFSYKGLSFSKDEHGNFSLQSSITPSGIFYKLTDYDDFVSKIAGKLQRHIGTKQEFLDKLRNKYPKVFYPIIKHVVNNIDFKKENGQLFRLEIPENNVLLDEDVVFSKQHPDIQDKLKSAISDDRLVQDASDYISEHNKHNDSEHVIFDNDSYVQELWSDLKYSIKGFYIENRSDIEKYQYHPKMKKILKIVKRYNLELDFNDFALGIPTQLQKLYNSFSDSKAPTYLLHDDYNGKFIYETIAYLLGSDKAASLFLKEYGIDGITYNGERDGRCFVIFDDKNMQITGKKFNPDGSINDLEQSRGSNGYDAKRTAEADALNTKRKVVSDEPDSLVPDTPVEAPTPDVAPSDPLRGRVAFLEDGKAVIEFFKAADATTAPHEIYHVYRRVMEKYSADVNASPTLKNDWITACEFVGAKPGEAWTREMEEKFARAGERFLMEGVAPHPELQNTFDRMKEWFTEVYTNADEAGLEISPEMRRVFGDALRLDSSDADIAFKFGLGSMCNDAPDGSINTHFEVPERKAGETDTQYNDRLQEYQNDADNLLNEALDSVQQDSPEMSGLVREAWEGKKAELDAEAKALDTRRQALMEAAMCDIRKG